MSSFLSRNKQNHVLIIKIYDVYIFSSLTVCFGFWVWVDALHPR